MDNTKIIAILAKLSAKYPDDLSSIIDDEERHFWLGYTSAITDIINELKGCE